LLSLRELELATAQDDLEAQAIRVRQNLGLREDERIPEFTTQLMESRPYIENLKKQGKVVRIENYLNTLDSQLKQTVSEEVIDSQRPDLSVVGKYSTSSYDPDYDRMTSNLSRTDYPVTYVGVNFSWYFGSDALSSQLSAAKKDAMASQYRAQQSQIESENAWKDFLRKYELSKQNVARLEKISQLQSERTKQEQSMFSRGRSVTLNVVNAETDAAEAQVNYLKAKSALRKLEASALLFTSVTE
ncbi:MAG: TolC family protein, partial [Bdellovibrionaceae bacterium]|nr:TolC family protein [Pseudobdellovibrionaceae bacterium]